MKIETREEFDTLPRGTVIRSDAGTIACRYDDRRAVLFGDERPFPWRDLALPVTVLWPPRSGASEPPEALVRRIERAITTFASSPDYHDNSDMARAVLAAIGEGTDA